MAFIDTVVDVQITAALATPTLANFGTPALVGYINTGVVTFPSLIQTYFDPSDMLSDGFTANDPLYLMAISLASQTPRPPSFKVIKGTVAVVQAFTFTVTDTNVGHSLGISIRSPLGVTTDAHVVGTGVAATDAASIAAILSALPDSTAAAVGPVITFTASTAGTLWYPSAFQGGTQLETTPSASPGTDLANALLVDSGFYGVSGEWMDATNILAVAVWTEANKRIHCYESADTANTVAASGIFHTLQLASYKRSVGLFCGSSTGKTETYGNVGWMAQRLTANPGSDTWAYKTIAATPVDTLSATQQTNILGNNGNFYISMAGVPITYDGRAASGLFIDITRGIDFLAADIQNRIATILVQSEKVPFTNGGISLITGAVRAGIQDGINNNFISNDPGNQPNVTAPDVKDVSPTDKANRFLDNVKFTAVATGAIHKVRVSGTVNL